jgi:hypothetical protein
MPDEKTSVIPQDDRTKPMTGGYYWFPIPAAASLCWNVLTCNELGCDADAGHPRLWPLAIDRLAQAWRKDRRLLRRRLRNHYTALPRGRVTRPDDAYLILHGDDSPIRDWKEAVIESFNLQGQRLRPLFDEHEQQLPYDVTAIAGILGAFKTFAERETNTTGP